MDFEQKYQQTPAWLKNKLTRRHVLKAAAGATVVAATPTFAQVTPNVVSQFQQALTQDKWQTLDAVLNHLLPSSPSGPGAKEIQATFYLYQLVHIQPSAQQEIDFIYQGVTWLEGFTQKRFNKAFYQLANEDKEQVLVGISRSQAGTNWLNMLIVNMYEAMLAPPSYGGNPDGIGWQWLQHPMGFPLPPEGKRYFELPARSNSTAPKTQTIAIKQVAPLEQSKRFQKA
ncbi:gluconate 2-dehydrogenase subunit 3 family protein [Thalassotalea marina]|uniref:Gluconate 2-dehydrogenase subunit 3 family protein n=1 Tax=Thalassotalea marina TaxID=1673741 RepID=A0A919EJI1_9GAMM|nr:gluconate 2-dehydrogenase subunit 3 family protein [Thalassotalea marina]GHF88414.1 hypothetical protein GCM10017161_15160 [Thalassotalea marina]